jgi:phosphatidylserine/phosphatidylglycerophosphate/cardiolipin synthase-like enzyme
VPVQVWTGSTNITLDGIFGHSNVGHLVRDPAVAAEYLSYWNVLATDPNLDQLHTWTSQHNVLPAGLPAPATTTVLFSPQARKQALEWYGQRLAASQKAAFYTGAFQTNKLLMNVFSKPTNFLCYILLEKRGKTVELTNRGPEKRIAVGAYNKDNKFLRWLGERSNPFGGGIQYIHTKNLLIDPLSDAPLVITGSANFSDNSTLYNDENMLLIYGDTRVADVYLTEFMRLFYHFYFRNLVSRMQAGSTPTANEYLDDTDGWTAEYYQAGTSKQKERLYFAG